jgi:hypothetical protein
MIVDYRKCLYNLLQILNSRILEVAHPMKGRVELGRLSHFGEDTGIPPTTFETEERKTQDARGGVGRGALESGGETVRRDSNR